jgi:hypothetical protein
MDNFYLDVDTGRQSRRIYLSQVRRLTYRPPAEQAAKKTAAPVRAAAPRRQAPAPVRLSEPQTERPVASQASASVPGSGNSAVVLALGIVAGVLFLLLLALVGLLLKRSGALVRRRRHLPDKRHRHRRS